MSNLKKIRESRAMTQAELAKAAGVNIRMIQNYEQGVKDINRARVVTVLNIADALKCGIRDILN